MTTYAPNFTPRARVKYNVAGVDHTVQLRGARGTSFGAMQGKIEFLYDIFNVWADTLASDFSWVSADIALTDDDVFNPASPPGNTPSGGLSPASFSPIRKITSTAFTGRAAGSRAAIYLYGVFWPQDIGTGVNDDAFNGVVTNGEDPRIGSTITLLVAAGASAGSGLPAVWHSRATIKPNDFLLHKVRAGIIS